MRIDCDLCGKGTIWPVTNLDDIGIPKVAGVLLVCADCRGTCTELYDRLMHDAQSEAKRRFREWMVEARYAPRTQATEGGRR